VARCRARPVLRSLSAYRAAVARIVAATAVVALVPTTAIPLALAHVAGSYTRSGASPPPQSAFSLAYRRLLGLHASVATDAGATPDVVASALGHSSPAVTHAHYIDGATARRARTRRVIGKVATASATAPRKRTRRATSKASSAAALRVVESGAPAAAQPAGSVHLVESGR
jgi:hypothetical protein